MVKNGATRLSVTIPEEKWRCLRNQKQCRALAKEYGVSADAILSQLKSGNTENRTFRIISYVPVYLSMEELLGDCTVLRRLVKERHLDPGKVKRDRWNCLRSRNAVVELDTADLSPGVTRKFSTALMQLYAARATPCFGLHVLLMVQREDIDLCGRQQQPEAKVAACPSLLERVPLSMLEKFIAGLTGARAAWTHDWLAPSANAARQQQNVADEASRYPLLFHICLWQRRYPLDLVTGLLSFFEDHIDLFTPQCPSDPTTSFRLEQLMETSQGLLYPELNKVPGLIRCDVLMAYPTTSLEEQLKLMQRLTTAAAARRRSSTSTLTPPHDRTSEDGCTRAVTAADNLRRHSHNPPDPRVLLRDFVDDATTVPARFCADLAASQYHVLRVAFEHHKRDGVRRLATLDYDVVAEESTPATSS